MLNADKIAEMFLVDKRLIVQATGKERAELIKYLEERGFSLTWRISDTRQKVMESVYPLDINLKRENIASLGGATAAWAAQTAGAILRSSEFYLLFSIYELQQSVDY